MGPGHASQPTEDPDRLRPLPRQHPPATWHAVAPPESCDAGKLARHSGRSRAETTRPLAPRRPAYSTPLLHARLKAAPWRQVPAGDLTRDAGHGRAETRTLKTAHAKDLGFPFACQAIKITRWRQDTATGKISRESVYAITSLASAQVTARDLARLAREHWTIEAHHHIRDMTFSEDTASRTGSGPANLATIRAAIITAIKDAGYLHIPEGRRDHTTAAEALHLHGHGLD
jgi:hypothetical protein